MASMWYGYENKASFFLVNCGFLLGSTVLAWAILKWLNTIMKEKGLK